jgi:hypothetical protein
MHALQVCAADIGNAFLYEKTKELMYVIAGPEFGEYEGQTLIIDKGLYGLRLSVARFHEHLAAKLRSMHLKRHFCGYRLLLYFYLRILWFLVQNQTI